MSPNKQKRNIILYNVIFFFVGCLITYIIMINYTKTITVKDNTKIYDKTSLYSSIKKVYDAVVVIESINGDEVTSTGSGFAYKVDSKYAYIITNEHVLTDFTIKVTNTENEKVEAEVLGKDPYLDIAIIKVKKEFIKKIVNFGNNDKTNIGDTIYTIGSPISINYKGTVTSGIVSGKDRFVQTSVGNNNDNWVMKVIQIDAPINKGNSGGPLLNVNGDVIGICSLKFTDEEIEGMGFAIPIEYVKDHIEELENGKEIKWPEIGITTKNIEDINNSINNIPETIKNGIVIVDIKKGEAADKAKLKKGDVIISVDDKEIKNISYFKYELFQHKIGDKIKIEYIRNGNKKTTTLEINSSK